MKTLADYLTDNNLTARYILDESGDTFGQIEINGKRYNVELSINPNIPDNLCNSIRIKKTRYHFCIDDFYNPFI